MVGNPDPPPPKAGEPPLHVAARSGHHDEIRRLVSEGAPIDEIFDVALEPGALAFPATPLMQAVASVDGASAETVELLLGLGASIEPPLFESVLACALGDLGWNGPRRSDAARLQVVVDAAHERKLELPAMTGEGRGAHYVVAVAAETGDPDRVQVLLDAGLDPDPEGLTSEWQWPLFKAVESGSVSTVQVLLRAGADPNKRFGRFGDPLLARVRSPEMLEALLDAGVAVEPKMVIDEGRDDEPDGAEKVLTGIATADAPMNSATPTSDLSLAARVAMVRRVIQARSVVPERVSRALRTVVFRAQPAGVEVLLAAGADPHGQPRLLRAVCFGAWATDDETWDPERVVGLLIRAGLDPDDEDERGFRPLLTAMSPDTFGPDYQESDGYNGPAALGLIRGGAQVNLVYPETDIEQLEPPRVAGWTPLLVAAHFADGPLVEALLDAGADPRVSTPQGRTAVDLARAHLTSLTARVRPEIPEDASPYGRRQFEDLIQSQSQELRAAERAVALLRAPATDR